MIKYRTGVYGNNLIEAIEIERETDASVWVKGRRNAKRTDWGNYFDTWQEAKQYLLDKARVKVDGLISQLEREKGKLENIKGLKAPN